MIKIAKKTAKILVRRFPRLAKSRYGQAAKAAGKILLAPKPPKHKQHTPPVHPVVNSNAIPDLIHAQLTTIERPEVLPLSFDKSASNTPIVFTRDEIAKPIHDFTEATCGPKADLVLCCAFKGRQELVRKIIHESLSDPSLKISWMLTGSTPEDAAFIYALASSTGRVAGFICANRPLGRKWQSCVQRAHQYYDAPLFGIVGSDDIVSHRLLGHIIRKHRKNYETKKLSQFMPALYCSLEWLVCHIDPLAPLSPNIVRCNYEYSTTFQPLGAGRFYTREFLEDCGGIIFESDKNRLLDDRGYFEVCQRNGHIEYYTMEDGPLICVKGKWTQLNSFDALLDAPTVDLQEFTFEGYALLKESLDPSTLKYLFQSFE